MKCVIAILALALITPALAEPNLPRTPGTTRYASMVRELKTLAANHDTRVTLTSLGKSVRGRDIWMARVHDGPASDPGKKILYICRQHGHEPAPTEGALAFLQMLAVAPPSSDLGGCLKHATVYVVPMANPDGAESFRRHNANNVDLNRDWLDRTQPETRALW
jgi:murein tripeptide amidase MpaA